MTREEIIQWYEDELARLRQAPHLNGCDMTPEWAKQIEVHTAAVAALRERETVTNRNGFNCTESNTVKVVDSDQFDGCEYCRDSKDIYEIRSPLHDSYNTDVYISENSLVMDIGCHSYGTVAIKFCPMCGRRLEAS